MGVSKVVAKEGPSACPKALKEVYTPPPPLQAHASGRGILVSQNRCPSKEGSALIVSWSRAIAASHETSLLKSGLLNVSQQVTRSEREEEEGRQGQEGQQGP